MPTPKGRTNNPNGRPKGSKNKFTNLKDAFLTAFDSPQLRGIDGLIEWAKENRGDFYKLVARMLPTNVTATIEHRRAAELSDAELLAIANGSSERAATAESGAQKPDSVH